MGGSKRYTTKSAATNGTSRIWTARNARKRMTSSPPKARSRSGVSPNRFFIRSPDLPDIPQLGVGVSQPFGQSLRQAETDLRAHPWMQVDDLHQIGMKKADQLGTLARDRRSRPRCITEQRHLTEKIAWFELRQQEPVLGPVLQDDIDLSRTDYVHPRARLRFNEDRFARVIGPDVNKPFQDFQLFGCEFVKKRNVLQVFGERLLARAKPKNIAPDAIRFHGKRILAQGLLAKGVEVAGNDESGPVVRMIAVGEGTEKIQLCCTQRLCDGHVSLREYLMEPDHEFGRARRFDRPQ